MFGQVLRVKGYYDVMIHKHHCEDVYDLIDLRVGRIDRIRDRWENHGQNTVNFEKMLSLYCIEESGMDNSMILNCECFGIFFIRVLGVKGYYDLMINKNHSEGGYVLINLRLGEAHLRVLAPKSAT